MSNRSGGAVEPPDDFAQLAEELARGAEVLPQGNEGLVEVLARAQESELPLTVKLGVDPTSSHLHLGHTVVLRALRRFQKRGDHVVLIIGGFTAQIGDPTGRDKTRPALTEEEVTANAEAFLKQVGRIIDLEQAVVIDNRRWFDSMSIKDQLGLISKVTVNQLVAKEGFGSRLRDNQSVGLHELLYPVLQGFDSVKVQADIEIGGTDQRFNLLMGRQLQPHFGQAPQAVMMFPILEGTDGKRKMSKSFDNAIALDDVPDDMFAKTMRLPDHLILKFMELATDMDSAAIEEERKFLDDGGNPKDAKERLARQIVKELHSEAEAEEALTNWRRVHSQRLMPEKMPSHILAEESSIISVLVESGLAPSRNQARKLIQQGGVRLDGEKVLSTDLVVTSPPEEGTVLQVGRKRFVRLVSGG